MGILHSLLSMRVSNRMPNTIAASPAESIRCPMRICRSLSLVALLVPSMALAPASLAQTSIPESSTTTGKVIQLFDGKTLQGWTSDRGEANPGNWEVVDGTIHCRGKKGGRGHLLSVERFASFSLNFEWKIAPGGNSGVKYRVARLKRRPSGEGWLGHEYQLLDDARHKNANNPRTSLGAIYALYAPVKDKPIRPAGQWNSSRIIVAGPHVSHWLNGERICGCEIGSEDWRQRMAQTKYSEAIGFGENQSGHLLLQDHGAETWFRNLEMTLLPQ